MNFNLKAAGTLLSRAKQVSHNNNSKKGNFFFGRLLLLFSLQKKNLVKLRNELNTMIISSIYSHQPIEQKRGLNG